MTQGREELLLILFIIFCASAGVQLFYYLWFYLSPVICRQPPSAGSKPPVSVVICARNEAENLQRFLPAVLGQNYPGFEVIVVNDCSEDNSDDVLGELLSQYPGLKVSTISRDAKFPHNKKFAQFIGIKAAANDILVFTDADCRPDSDKWLAGMVSNFTPGTEFVLGYGGYMMKKGILNSYIRYETMFIAMQYIGMALRGLPYMGVGRNLAYRKEVFFRNRGFGKHGHIVSGDDDLFVNSNANFRNTRVTISPGTATRSLPASSAEEWAKQKHRHLSTAKYYKLRDKVLLVLEPFTRVLFYALFIVLIINTYLWPWLLAVFLLRLSAQVVILELNRRILLEKKILFHSLIFDIFSPLLNTVLYFGTFRIKRGSTAWK